MAMSTPPPKQLRTVTKGVVKQRLIASGLQRARHMGDIVEKEPKRQNSQLLVILGFCHDDSYVDFTSPKRATFEGGTMVKMSRTYRSKASGYRGTDGWSA